MACRLFLLPLWFGLQGAFAAVPSHIATELPEARLSGAGTYRWFGLRIYDAQLWVGPQGYKENAAPFALDLRYAHAFTGTKIAERSVAEMEQLGLGTQDQRSNWLAQMRNCFPDVEDGTHLTGVNLPGAGVRYYRDGRAICDIKDTQFASAFFAIWLDPRSPAPALRAKLLGQDR
ncbi:MAG: chalcone isomerase family protein [Burkholderiaceae bacterium]|nr:chalcone isomerase family protein [Burkholderiaceae bacterium]